MLILHHYDLSPFAEKIRLALGLKGLAWRSVQIPSCLPKPDYLALTGGYRRTPSLQIGADIYCDTRLIVSELEARWPQPTLFPGGDVQAHREIEAQAETALFWPCALLATGVNAEALPAGFHADRAAMRGRTAPDTAQVRAAGAHARGEVAQQLAWVEHVLAAGGDWLLGGAPGLADFAVYHALWFLEQLPQRLLGGFGPSRALHEWYARVAALGHGQRVELTAADAIDIARAATPAALPCDADGPFAVGREVLIEPVEKTSAAVRGTVAACTSGRIAIDRVDPRAGEVRVHFPLAAYRVTAC